MALRGSLADMNIGDVLQLPTMGAKTGELHVEHNGLESSIFYRNGRIVHIRLGDDRDEEALVTVLSWVEGNFSFHVGLESPENTLDEDLPRLLMRAAKRRDEVDKIRQSKHSTSLDSPEFTKILQETLESNDGFQVVAFIDKEGRQLNVRPEGSKHISTAVEFATRCFLLSENAPRSDVRRCLLEDDDGHILWLRLGAEVSMILLTETRVSMGVLMHSASKIGAKLKQLLGDPAEKKS